MVALPKSLSSRQKGVLILLAAAVVTSILYHNHPHMDGLQDQLRSKAPALLKLFVGGEAIYFGGMILMTLGLGATLGPNPLAWPGKFRTLMAADNPGLANAKAFWAGFVLSSVGSLTFGVIGLYVAVEILPGGSWTLIPASLVDISFSVLVRLAFYRRFTRQAAPPDGDL